MYSIVTAERLKRFLINDPLFDASLHRNFDKKWTLSGQNYKQNETLGYIVNTIPPPSLFSKSSQSFPLQQNFLL